MFVLCPAGGPSLEYKSPRRTTQLQTILSSLINLSNWDRTMAITLSALYSIVQEREKFVLVYYPAVNRDLKLQTAGLQNNKRILLLQFHGDSN